MSPAMKLIGIERMNVDERIALVAELRECHRHGPGLQSDSQRAELQKRVADHAANPDDVISWDEAKPSALKQIGK